MLRVEATAALRPLGAATRSGLADFAAIFTWRSWLLGWLVRVGSQACLYGLLGRMLGSPAHQRYLFVGASVLVSGTEALLACSSTVNERRVGALPLIVSSPSPVLPVLLGRGVLWVPGGIATSTVCLFGLGPLFGVRWSGTQALCVLALLVLTSLSTYGLALALGAVVLGRPELRNVVGTAAAAGLAVVCGVAVPLGEWPWAVRAIGTSVPLTHTLAGVRAALDGASAVTVLACAGRAVVWGLAWLGVSWFALRRLDGAGRRDGSIEFGG
jgi:ABC-2 type transport system permease protein